MPPPKVKRTITLEAGKSVFGGDCLSVAEDRPCFVEGALPGETVEVRILSENKRLLRARVTRVLKAAPGRVSPACPHTDLCGGCQYQHVSYERELELKHAQISELVLGTLGPAARVEPIRRSPRELGYRRSATFQLVSRAKGSPPSLAYIAKDNTTPVYLKECGLLDPMLEDLVRTGIRLKPGKEKITFKCTEKGPVSDQKELFFRVRLLGQELLGHSRGFFQVNHEVTALIAEEAAREVKAAAPRVFWDLYAGVGTFSFLAAPEEAKLVLIEESPYAVQALKMNLAERPSRKAEVIEGRVEAAFRGAWEANGSEDALIFMDPPRQGLGEGLAETLRSRVNAKGLLYLSCDPSTLCRDLRSILAGGAWKLERLIPYDMFPRTRHVEVLACLSKII